MLRVKFERQHQNLSQHAVAVVTQVPQPEISRIETGRLKPTPAQLERLAKFFNVAPEDLLRDVAILGPSR